MIDTLSVLSYSKYGRNEEKKMYKLKILKYRIHFWIHSKLSTSTHFNINKKKDASHPVPGIESFQCTQENDTNDIETSIRFIR